MPLHVEFGVLMVTCGFSVTVSIVVNTIVRKNWTQITDENLCMWEQTSFIGFICVQFCARALKRFTSTTINAVR